MIHFKMAVASKQIQIQLDAEISNPFSATLPVIVLRTCLTHSVSGPPNSSNSSDVS